MKTRTIAITSILVVGALGAILLNMDYSNIDNPKPGEVSGQERLLSPQAFAEVLATDQDRTLVDVRTPAEYAAGHIAGASNIDFYEADFLEQFQSFDQDQPLAIYCRSGSRSGQALQALQAAGFSDVVDLSGGIMAWENAGGEVE